MEHCSGGFQENANKLKGTQIRTGDKGFAILALPLGHAAENEIFIQSNRISQAEQNLLFLSNGHGEDTIACRVIEALHGINPDISLEVLPIVGEGKVFEKFKEDGWLSKIGSSTCLPSGGFSNQSLSGLVSDLQAGLFGALAAMDLFIDQ